MADSYKPVDPDRPDLDEGTNVVRAHAASARHLLQLPSEQEYRGRQDQARSDRLAAEPSQVSGGRNVCDGQVLGG